MNRDIVKPIPPSQATPKIWPPADPSGEHGDPKGDPDPARPPDTDEFLRHEPDHDTQRHRMDEALVYLDRPEVDTGIGQGKAGNHDERDPGGQGMFHALLRRLARLLHVLRNRRQALIAHLPKRLFKFLQPLTN